MEKLKEADDEVESGVLLSDEDMQVITKILEAGKKIISLVNEGKKKLNQSKIEDGKLFVKDKSTNGFVVISSDRIYPVDEDMKPTAGSAEIFSLLAFLESWIDS